MKSNTRKHLLPLIGIAIVHLTIILLIRPVLDACLRPEPAVNTWRPHRWSEGFYDTKGCLNGCGTLQVMETVFDWKDGRKAEIHYIKDGQKSVLPFDCISDYSDPGLNFEVPARRKSFVQAERPWYDVPSYPPVR